MLVALAVILLPMLLTGPVERTRVDVPVDVPQRPEIAPVEALPSTEDLDGPGPAPVPQLEPGGEFGRASGEAPQSGVRPAPVPEPEQSGADIEDGGGDRATAGPPPASGNDTDEVPPRAVPAFVVQLGAFSREDNALGLRDRLRDVGLPAFVESAGAELHRVQLGPVATRDEAEGLAARARERMDLDGIIVSR